MNKNENYQFVRNCVRCQQPFKAISERHRYCKPCGKTLIVKVSPITKLCPVCNTNFATSHKSKICCSRKCANIRLKAAQNKGKQEDQKKEAVEKQCPTCNNKFVVKKQQIYCSPNCRPLSNRVRSKPPIKLTRPKRTKKHVELRLPKPKRRAIGYYVYGWRIKGESLPFYVGKGIGKRAWLVHNLSKNREAACQYIRSTIGSSNVEVIIYRDNLTKVGAIFAESVLIDTFNKSGALLTNQHPGTRRKLNPPFILP